MRHGGEILIDQLKIQGVSRVFLVPGESFLAALDALHDASIENIVCRQEGGAAMMAEAHAKLTGQPGISFVTGGARCDKCLGRGACGTTGFNTDDPVRGPDRPRSSRP